MRILVVAGASGGHIYPALAFLERFLKENKKTEALLVLPSRSIKADFSSCSYPIQYISSGQVSFSLTRKSVLAFLNFLKGGWESFRILIKFKPDIVVGFGSIDSIFPVLLAWFFRIKTVIHEQNLLPGKANRFLSRFVDKVAVSYSDTKQYFNLLECKIFITGNPIRGGLRKIEREKALDFFGLRKDKFTILVMGGSQGSEHINTVVLKAVELIKNRESLQFIHLFGRDDYSEAIETYTKLNVQAKVFGFFKAMEFAYSASDLAITRAGGSTISELIYYKLAAIISPYPYAYEHQLENARVLEKAGSGLIIQDGEFTPLRLKEIIEDFMRDSSKIVRMRLGYKSIAGVDAADELVRATGSMI